MEMKCIVRTYFPLRPTASICPSKERKTWDQRSGLELHGSSMHHLTNVGLRQSLPYFVGGDTLTAVKHDGFLGVDGLQSLA